MGLERVHVNEHLYTSPGLATIDQEAALRFGRAAVDGLAEQVEEERHPTERSRHQTIRTNWGNTSDGLPTFYAAFFFLRRHAGPAGWASYPATPKWRMDPQVVGWMGKHYRIYNETTPRPQRHQKDYSNIDPR